MQELHCPLPPGSEAVYCRSPTNYTKLSCKCGMTIPGARLNQSIACVGTKKHPAASGGIWWGLGLASGSIWQQRVLACADICHAGY